MGVNPFWSERVEEEMRLREARPEGLPPVPESGDEEEVARTPLRAVQEETAAQRRKARAFMTPEERAVEEKRDRALQAVKEDREKKRSGLEATPRGDGAGSAKDRVG